ncbi:hypothetical protein TNCV_4811401 [Trichonephila clavipes]|nr:hypothetical protein TNCV_4811401 [Trichonephila clavipes]
MPRQVTVTKIFRSCGHVGHSTADTIGQRIVGSIKKSSVLAKSACDTPSPRLEVSSLHPRDPDLLGISGKIELSLQGVWELLESLPSESSDSPTGDSSDEEVPANNLLEFSSDSEEHDEEIEQDPGCSSFYSEDTAFPTSGCNKSKVIRQWKKKRCPNRSSNPPP